MSQQRDTANDDPTLVPAPDVLDTPARRVVGILVAILFLGGLGGIGLLDALSPVPLPELEGPELTRDLAERSKAQVRNGTQMAIWSRDIDTRSNAKRALLPWYLSSLIRFLREADSGHLVGKDHWLFTKHRLQSPGQPNDTRQAELGARILRGIERRCVQMRTELLFLPVPRKGVVAAEFLPDGVDAFPKFEEILRQRLSAWGVPFVDMLNLFKGHTAEELWYAHDTHWRPEAIQLVAQDIANRLDLGLRPGQRVAFEADAGPRRPRRGILATMGIPQKHPAALAIPVAPGPTLQLQNKNFRKRGLPRIWRIPPSNEPPVWGITGSSFTRGDILVPLLVNNLGSVPYNGATKGALGLKALGEGLRRLSDQQPRHWLAEFPTFQLFTGVTRRGSLLVNSDAIDFFSLTDGPERQVLAELETQGRLPLHVRPGMAVHDGDGSLAIEITAREAAGERSFLNVYQQPMGYPVRWSKGRKTLRIPLLAPQRTWAEIVVRPGPNSPLGAITARLVCDYDLANGASALPQPASPPAEGEPWSRDYHFSAPLSASRFEALWIQTPGQERTNWNVSLIPPQEDGRNRDIGNLVVTPYTTALLFAGSRGGPGRKVHRRFIGVRLRGKGALPGDQTSIRLVSLLRR